MSLFEDPLYRWRETFFVLFEVGDRPDAATTKNMLRELQSEYEVAEIREDDAGQFESFTLVAPEDFAAMDVTYLAGEDVTSQVEELLEDQSNGRLELADDQQMAKLKRCDARFEVYHFEQLSSDDDEEFLDPGTLFMVMKALAQSCQGIGIDPQSGTVVT